MSVVYCKKPTSSPLIDEGIFEIGGWVIIKVSTIADVLKIFVGSAYWTVTVVVPVVVVPVIALLLNRFNVPPVILIFPLEVVGLLKLIGLPTCIWSLVPGLT